MKLKEFHIFNYGPLYFETPFKLGNFNLFYGKNEKGKTLTIEALIKLLYKKYTGFDRIERVEGLPSGYIIIEDDDLKQIKISGNLDFSKLFKISPSELRNIFVIRSSDLSIPDETGFYAEITDKITGLDIGRLEKIRSKLFEIALITPRTRIFSDTGVERLKTRLDRAKELIEREIPRLIDDIEDSGYDDAVKIIIDLENEIRSLREKRKLLEEARKGAKCREALEYLDRLSAAKERLEEYAVFTHDGYEKWLNLDREVEVLEKNYGEMMDDLEEMKENLGRYKKALENIKKRMEDVKKVYEVIETELKPAIEKAASTEVKLRVSKNRTGLFKTLLILFGALTGVSIFSSVFAGISSIRMFFLLVTGIFCSGFLASLFATLINVIRRSRYLRDIGIISHGFSGLGIIASTVDDFLRESSRIKSEYEELQTEYPVALSRVKSGEERLRDKKQALQKIRSRLEELNNNIRGYRYTYGVGSLEEFAEKLRDKRKIESEVVSCLNILDSLFPVNEDWAGKREDYWRKKINELKPYLEKAKGIEFRDEKIEEIENELSLKEEKLETLTDEVEQFRLRLSELEKEVNNVLRNNEDYYFISTKQDLEYIRKILSDFVNERERLRKDVIFLDEVIKEIKSGEREKISQLFGAENPVSRYFSKITGGRYSEVNYDSEGRSVMVTLSGGMTLESWRLSSGAYDQLYLSIRLALAERLLGGKKGFFIFDDPFIKSDYERLGRQMDLLKEFSSWGWQVLYFTSKNEILDVLKGDIKNKKLLYFELQDKI